jgi:hypothetical protein
MAKLYTMVCFLIQIKRQHRAQGHILGRRFENKSSGSRLFALKSEFYLRQLDQRCPALLLC